MARRHSPEQLGDEDGEDEGQDTLSELFISGARPQGGVGGARPIWLQGRDRKYGGMGAGVGVSSAEGGGGGSAEAESFHAAGAARRRERERERGTAGPSVLGVQSSVVLPEDSASTPELMQPRVSHGGGPEGFMGAGGRGRRGIAGNKAVGGISGSAIRAAAAHGAHGHHGQAHGSGPHDPVRESQDSLSVFARGHAGRLAPSIAAAKHSAKQASATKRFAVTGVAAGKEDGAEGLAPRLGRRAARHEAARDAGHAPLAHGRFDALNRLGSAPEEGRSECAEVDMSSWSVNREVFSAHGSKDPSIRLDLQPFHIPVLPSGRHVRLDIITTWGDPHYVGLSGLEMFDDRGAPIRVSASSISADPADINVLPGYGNDPRTVDKVVDGVNRTCDDLHMWLTPFTAGRHHYVFIDLGASRTVSMLRLWNYNKSRIHSYRGARYMEVLLDERPIFKGEVQKAPGMLQGAEELAENILFTTDEEVLCAIEAHDSTDVNINPGTGHLSTPPFGAERPKTSEGRPKTSESRPKTAGRSRGGSADSNKVLRVGSASSAGSGHAPGDGDVNPSEGAGEESGADWGYLAKDSQIHGPTERLPPDLVVSETGHVSKEGTGGGAAVMGQQRVAVGADGRPMTSAGAGGWGGGAGGGGAQLASLDEIPELGEVGWRRGDGGGGCVSGRVLTLRLDSNWGDAHAIGLWRLELIGPDENALRVHTGMLSVSVECAGADITAQLRGTGGGDGFLDAAHAAKLFEGGLPNNDAQDGWVLPVHIGNKRVVYTLRIDLGRELVVERLRVRNYNESLEGSYRGVKRLVVWMDQTRVSPPVGYLVRKGPGPMSREVSFAQTIRLEPLSERIGTPFIFFGSSGGKAGAAMGVSGAGEIVQQEYEPPTLPSGFIFKFALLSTWDDRFYIGLNGLELYDQFDRIVPITTDNLHVVCTGGVSSVADLAECAGDPRSADKLIDGCNASNNDHHAWLAPYRRSEPTVICLMFDEPVTLSVLKIWNYSKTPGRGVRELHLSIDDVLVYKGHIRKADASSSEDQGQSILFTNDRRVVAREQPNVYVHYMSEAADTIFIDASGGDTYETGAGPESFEARPGTSVHPSAYS